MRESAACCCGRRGTAGDSASGWGMTSFSSPSSLFSLFTALPENLLFLLLLLLLLSSPLPSTAGPPLTFNCFSCANAFMVWQWRHYFLKRNYGLTTSDASCGQQTLIQNPGAASDTFQACSSSCFVLFINGTHKHTRLTKAFGVARGCSSQYMTADQHEHLGLGYHSRLSHVGHYLPPEFDQYELVEHWCFCSSEYCNTMACYGNGRLPFSLLMKRGSYLAPQKYANFFLSSAPKSNFFIFLLLMNIMLCIRL